MHELPIILSRYSENLIVFLYFISYYAYAYIISSTYLVTTECRIELRCLILQVNLQVQKGLPTIQFSNYMDPIS